MVTTTSPRRYRRRGGFFAICAGKCLLLPPRGGVDCGCVPDGSGDTPSHLFNVREKQNMSTHHLKRGSSLLIWIVIVVALSHPLQSSVIADGPCWVTDGSDVCTEVGNCGVSGTPCGDCLTCMHEFQSARVWWAVPAHMGLAQKQVDDEVYCLVKYASCVPDDTVPCGWSCELAGFFASCGPPFERSRGVGASCP
jgi:hypothetical protein